MSLVCLIARKPNTAAADRPTKRMIVKGKSFAEVRAEVRRVYPTGWDIDEVL
jgi:hypothetical protein